MGTRENLLKAASDLMREVGFEGMTTAQIAKRAGVAEGTIYRHFTGKEALIEAVFKGIWASLNTYMEDHLPPRSEPAARLDAWFPTTLGGLEEVMKDYHSLSQQEQLYYASKQQCCGEPLPAGLTDYVDLLEEAIREAQKVAHVRPEVDPKVAALFIFAGASTVLDVYGDPTRCGASVLDPAHVVDQLDRLTRAMILVGGAR